MAIDFPSSPVDGQTTVINDVTYTYYTSPGAWVATSVPSAVTGVTAGTYGGANTRPVITVDQYGRLSYAANTSAVTLIDVITYNLGIG